MSWAPTPQRRLGMQHESRELHLACETLVIGKDAVLAEEHSSAAHSLRQDQVNCVVKDRKGACEWPTITGA